MAKDNILPQQVNTSAPVELIHTNAVAKQVLIFSKNSLVVATATIVVPSNDSSACKKSSKGATSRSPTLDEQLQQRPKRNTPKPSKEYQEFVSKSQPSFEVTEKPVYEELKQRRQQTQALTATVAGAVGLITLGPVGVVLGAVSASAITKGIAKSKERETINEYEQRTEYLTRIPAGRGELVVRSTERHGNNCTYIDI